MCPSILILPFFLESNGMNLASSTVIMSTQNRYRNVLQWPSNNGTACPTLVQRNPCPLLGAPCTIHKWKPKPWSKCILPPDVTCGDGVRVRGKNVHMAYWMKQIWYRQFKSVALLDGFCCFGVAFRFPPQCCYHSNLSIRTRNIVAAVPSLSEFQINF